MARDSERFCPEGIPKKHIGDVVLSALDSRILCTILREVVEGGDASEFVEEARIIFDVISDQIRPYDNGP